MRNDEELYEISQRAKAWYTNYQQQLPAIRAKRLPTETESVDIYGTLKMVGLAIKAVDYVGLEIELRNKIADWLSDYQIEVTTGQTYVERTYSFLNNYVIFSQDV
jgi:hypothetical protein